MRSNHVALILVEGETEELFYKRLSEEKLGGIPKKIRNMRGNYNINNKILDKSRQFSDLNPNSTFDVYVCVDRERTGTPIYNQLIVDDKIASIRGFNKKIDIVAELMLESLFFIDIKNIYKYLRTPNSKRSKTKYKNFRQLTHRELTQLFELYGKQYYKGQKCEPLVKILDLEHIISNATEINLLISNVRQRHELLN